MLLSRDLSDQCQYNQLGAITFGMIIKGLILFALLYWLISPWLENQSFFSSLPSFSSYTQSSSKEESGQLQQVKVGEKIYTMEIVTTPEDISRGLGGRADIGSDGMLFVLNGEQVARFWMKDMLFPIDMIWIYQGKIVSYTPNAQPPQAGTPDLELQIYESGQLVDMVLEVPAGFSVQEGFAAGMDVMILDQ